MAAHESGERLALEKAVDDVLSPLKDFIRSQTVSAVVLLLATLAGLVMANSRFAELYATIGHLPIALSLGEMRLEMSLHHWVNDGLMVLFFFMLGLEIKREMLAGELQGPRAAALVIASAVGGMAVPALLFFAINLGHAGVDGWAIPMATDAAFALGALALLAGRVPAGLSVFLVGLAIIDDIGAVLVVAIFYTDSLMLQPLAWAGAAVAMLIAMNLLGVRRLWPFVLVGIGLWLAVLASGVHATIAGVILALTIPARARLSSSAFIDGTRRLLDEHEQALRDSEGALGDEGRHAIANRLREGTRNVTAPLQRWEHNVELPVSYMVMPLFAFLNAGVRLDEVPVSTWFTDPLSLGIILGLVVGKFTGILGCAWLACRTGLGVLPDGVSLRHVAGAGLLAGMGFTMSLFIAALAFEPGSQALVQAKAGILVASGIAGVLGFTWLWFTGRGSGADDAGLD